MAKFVIDKSSGSGTATIKVKPNSSNDTSKVNSGVLKVYKKGNSDEKTLVTQVNLTQKILVKPVTTYHLELWNSDGSEKLFSLPGDSDTYEDTIINLFGLGLSSLGTNTYILKSYSLTKTGDVTTSREKVPIILSFTDNHLNVDYSDTYNTSVSIDDTKLVIKNTEYNDDRTTVINISQSPKSMWSEGETVNDMKLSLRIYDLTNIPIS